jgi:hypothetical protein
MGGFVKALFGGAPKASTAAAVDVEEDKKKSKKSRSQLLSTQGGIVGEELNPDQVQNTRPTLLGN